MAFERFDSTDSTRIWELLNRLGDDLTDELAGALRGDPDKQYELMVGTIRNSGSGWAFIDDSGHHPSGFGTVTQTSTDIVIAHDNVAGKVGAVIAVPDETLASLGVRAGASVGLDKTIVNLYTEPDDRISDLVQWTGSAWQSTMGVFTGFSYSGGVLTLTHEAMGTAKQYGVALAGRGNLYPAAGGIGNTTTEVAFYSGSFGSLVAAGAPSASGHRVWVTRYGRRASVPAADPASVVAAFGNIWLIGIMEKA